MSEAGLDVAYTTIIHGYKKAKALIDNDSDYQHMIDKIQENV